MTNSSALVFRQYSEKLESVYGSQEARSIAFLLLENVFSLSRSEILSDKKIALTENVTILDSYVERLLNEEPIQYILGRTEFYGHQFEVNSSVLIPRQETEELVHLIISEHKKKHPISILDIGTGSGCIAIALKKAFPEASVYAIDVSEKALATAKRNALLNKVEINFIENDILLTDAVIPETTIVVSNPPYVLHSEKKLMGNNVLEHEPHLALFADEDNPLVFYKVITEKAKRYLLPKGELYFEINEQFGKKTVELLVQSGFREVQLLKDLNEKDRIVKGVKK